MCPINKPYSSQEVVHVVDRWQFCRFFDLKTQEDIILLPYHELYRRDSQLRCNPVMLEQIKTALTKAYNQGIREVGMLAPHVLRIELIHIALSITSDPDWKIYPRAEFTYFKNLAEIQERIYDDATFYAPIDIQLTRLQKEMCDDLGFTEDIILELFDNLDKDFEELPEHLQKLFAEWDEAQEKKA